MLFLHLILALESSSSMVFQPRSEAGGSGRFGIPTTVRIRRSSWKDAGQDERFVAEMRKVHERGDFVELIVIECMRIRSARMVI